MELWIRSQDKTILTPISEKLQILANIDIPQEQYIVMYKGEELGNYNSKERALEVLDEINEEIKGTKILNYLNKHNGNLDNVFPILTYEMPEE